MIRSLRRVASEPQDMDFTSQKATRRPFLFRRKNVRRRAVGPGGAADAQGVRRSPASGRSRASGARRSPASGRSRASGTRRSPASGRSRASGARRSPASGRSRASGARRSPASGRSRASGTGPQRGRKFSGMSSSDCSSSGIPALIWAMRPIRATPPVMAARPTTPATLQTARATANRDSER